METVFKGRARARVSLIHIFVRRFAVAVAAIFLLTDGRHAHVDPAPVEILGGADVDTLARRPNVNGYLIKLCLSSYCIWPCSSSSIAMSL